MLKILNLMTNLYRFHREWEFEKGKHIGSSISISKRRSIWVNVLMDESSLSSGAEKYSVF